MSPQPHRLLIVDDSPDNIRSLGEQLTNSGYAVSVATSGEAALSRIEQEPPDLVLMDVVMPGLSGYEVCQRLRASAKTRMLPVILVTGLRPSEERIQGLDAGADDFLTKPINREEMLARVRSLLRVSTLHRRVEQQAQQLADWNQKLETRVREQIVQLDRLGRLKNFFPPQVAELILADGEEQLYHPRRRQVTVCISDLRGFTPFSEGAEPEEVMEVLNEYYRELGAVVERHGGTVESFAGDGMTIIFNAPVEISDPELRAVRMALEMRESFMPLRERWGRRGHSLGLGIGLANGYATVGALGYSSRWQYSAIGLVTNLAARLCGDAQHGEILVTTRVYRAVESLVEGEQAGERNIRGLQKPVPVVKLLKPR